MKIVQTREDLLKLLPHHSIGVEIGVFRGEFSDIILKLVKPSKLVLIDPWLGNIRSGDKNGNNMQYIDGNKYYQDVILPKYDSNPAVAVLKNRSSILSTFKDDHFDWGYIDGDHSYEGVKHDLTLLRHKVKPNGIIMGHDYIVPRFAGVVKAVDEFVQHHNLTISYITSDGCPSFYIVNSK